MGKSIINILALVFLCISAFGIFWKREILKDKNSNKVITTSGFVVSIVSLLVIYFVNM